MTDTAHTPTPWQIEGECGWISTMHPSPIFALDGILGTREQHIADAAHIVKCVNEAEAKDNRIAELEASLESTWLAFETILEKKKRTGKCGLTVEDVNALSAANNQAEAILAKAGEA